MNEFPSRSVSPPALESPQTFWKQEKQSLTLTLCLRQSGDDSGTWMGDLVCEMRAEQRVGGSPSW